MAVERQTVAQFLDRWLDEVARHKLATSTFESYDRKIRLHVLPQLGRLTLAKLTPQRLTGLYCRDLRHSAATVLLLLSVHPKVVQERLGHATIGVTMDIYSHVMPSMQREATEKLEASLTGSA